MQLYVVNFIPLLSSLYMFRVAHMPIIRSTMFNCIYSHLVQTIVSAQIVTATFSQCSLTLTSRRQVHNFTFTITI